MNKVQNISEESDAIETDIHEDTDSGGEVLTPEDKHLIDIDNCSTHKEFSKRVGALKRSIQKRSKRIETIEKKIINLEHKELGNRSRKLLKAMNTEKHAVQERLNALTKALKVAIEKLEEFPETEEKLKKRMEEKLKKKAKKEGIKKLREKEKPKDPVKEKIKEIIVAEDSTPALELPSVKDFWSINAETLSKNVQQLKEDEESSSSDEEVSEN